MLYDISVSGDCEIYGMELREEMDMVLSNLNKDSDIKQRDTGFGFGSRDHSFFYLTKEEADFVVEYYQSRLGDKINIQVSESNLDDFQDEDDE